VFEKPPEALMTDLERFVFRHRIFVEAREFEDGVIFVREPKGRSKKLGPRRHFEVFLRRERRRVHFYTVTCGSADQMKSQVPIVFPEKALLRAAQAALEYEDCGRDVTRYSAAYPKDLDAGRALFGYVRSESRLLEQLLGARLYRDLLRIVRRHRRERESRPPNKRMQPPRGRGRPHSGPATRAADAPAVRRIRDE
jgi:hypothetical protein